MQHPGRRLLMSRASEPGWVVVTRGPAFERIDAVRRITNFSTGELGARLARALAGAGWPVVVLTGKLAVSPLAPNSGEERFFGTNDDLATAVQTLAKERPVAAFFHTAALCDHRVVTVRDASGTVRGEAKIPSRAGGLTLQLEPARKIISDLRDWFPTARLVGWKYEMDGTRSEAWAQGTRLIAENWLDACVVNGAAFGPGFGWLKADADREVLADKAALGSRLTRWLGSPIVTKM